MEQKIPIQFWGNSIPTIPVKAAIQEYSLFSRAYFRAKSHEIPNVIPYIIPTDTPTPIFLVAPGGGYHERAIHEGKPIAEWLNSIGISAFVLNYRHAPFRFPIPFLDAQRAVRFIRASADKLNIDPNRLGMIGFSAGGHLTSTMGTLADRDWFPTEYIPDSIDSMPDHLNVQIICYPVISMITMTHRGSRQNLLGKNPNPELLELLSNEKHVSSSTPPTFIWTTKPDKAISYQHSVWYADAVKAQGIVCEFHLFDHGRHGLGLAEKDPEIHQWTRFCEDWLKMRSFIP